ncbi:MAG: methyltransferase FkbM family [Candidatus Solibacter sp.]|jgi:FkbM family methyltransferase|nr:methyltransferase FkbM family [Candidatus Solibacter sp.]
MNLHELLTELLAEPLDQVDERTRSAFDRMAGRFERDIVIFGSGYLGKLVLSGLRTAGIEPLAFCDNNSAMWGKQVDGVTVLSPAAAAEQYRDRAVFVVAIYNSAARQAQLRELGCTRVASYPVLFWKHWRSMPKEERLELPRRILERADELAAGYDLLSDERSRTEFLAQIRWRCLLDYACLPQPDPARDMYYPADLFRLLPDEAFVDCGAFDGDSIRGYLEHAGGNFGRIYALEADAGNVSALNRYRASLPADMAERIEVLPYAVAKQDGVARFCAEGYEGSKVVDAGATVEVQCRTLDGLLAGSGASLIKMDIEGAELDALAGAREIMARCRPVMAICVYHKCDHLWVIPQLLKQGNPDYRIFLRRYAEDCWETVYYAVPAERLVARTADPLS